jgi:hypothetical protein
MAAVSLKNERPHRAPSGITPSPIMSPSPNGSRTDIRPGARATAVITHTDRPAIFASGAAALRSSPRFDLYSNSSTLSGKSRLARCGGGNLQ